MTAQIITIPTEAALWVRFVEAVDRWHTANSFEAFVAAVDAYAAWAGVFLRDAA